MIILAQIRSNGHLSDRRGKQATNQATIIRLTGNLAPIKRVYPAISGFETTKIIIELASENSLAIFLLRPKAVLETRNSALGRGRKSNENR